MRWICMAAIVAASAGCGKKGPPLAPFSRVPNLITSVTPQRVGSDVYLTFTVPDANADGQKPASIGAIEMYAVTSATAPATEAQREAASLIATVPVHPILPEPPVSANGSAPPPIPLPPGVDQGAVVSVKETLTPETRTAVELPVDKALQRTAAIERDDERIGPLVAPAPIELPRRHYFAVAVSPRGRKSMPSTPISVPLESGSSAPGAPTITNTPSEMTITWTAPPDARTATIAPPPTVKPTVGANATPSNITPARPLLVAKSL